MAYNLPPPWDPGYALPDNVRDEGLERRAFVTKQMPRGTYDAPHVGTGGYVVPNYVKAERYGQGAFVTQWQRRGTNNVGRIPQWVQRQPTVIGQRSIGPTGNKVTFRVRDVSPGAGMAGLGGISGEPPIPGLYEQYGQQAAGIILEKIAALEPGKRKAQLKAILDRLDPSLWGRTADIARRYTAQGMTAAQAVYQGLARAMSAGLAAEIIRTGKSSRAPQPNSLLGLGCSGAYEALGGATTSGFSKTTHSGGASTTSQKPIVYSESARGYTRQGIYQLTLRYIAETRAKIAAQQAKMQADFSSGALPACQGDWSFSCNTNKDDIPRFLTLADQMLLWPLNTIMILGVPFAPSDVSGRSVAEKTFVPTAEQRFLIDRAVYVKSQVDIAERYYGLDISDRKDIEAFLNGTGGLMTAMLNSGQHSNMSINEFFGRVKLEDGKPWLTTSIEGYGMNPVQPTAEELTTPGGVKSYYGRGGFFLSRTVAAGSREVVHGPLAYYSSLCWADHCPSGLPRPGGVGKKFMGDGAGWMTYVRISPTAYSIRAVADDRGGFVGTIIGGAGKVLDTVIDLPGDIADKLGDLVCKTVTSPNATQAGAAAGVAAGGGQAGAAAGAAGAAIAANLCGGTQTPVIPVAPPPQSSILPLALVAGGVVVAAAVLGGRRKKTSP